MTSRPRRGIHGALAVQHAFLRNRVAGLKDITVRYAYGMRVAFRVEM